MQHSPCTKYLTRRSILQVWNTVLEVRKCWTHSHFSYKLHITRAAFPLPHPPPSNSLYKHHEHMKLECCSFSLGSSVLREIQESRLKKKASILQRCCVSHQHRRYVYLHYKKSHGRLTLVHGFQMLKFRLIE